MKASQLQDPTASTRAVVTVLEDDEDDALLRALLYLGRRVEQIHAMTELMAARLDIRSQDVDALIAQAIRRHPAGRRR